MKQLPYLVECPCCEGEGALIVHDETTMQPFPPVDCTHCGGKGEVFAEVLEPATTEGHE